MKETQQAPPTIGERRVRTDFNVANDSTVGEIKLVAAGCINQMQAIWNDSVAAGAGMDMTSFNASYGEQRRLIALAQTAYEEAAMWAVKAATYTPYP